MKQKVIESIDQNKIIAIVRGLTPDKVEKTMQAIADGGVKLCEITFDQTKPDMYTAEMIEKAAKVLDGKMHIGAGTVLTPTQVELTAKAGGRFVISPDTFAPVIEKANALGLVSIPGAFTPSEILNAHRYGADFVKLFPLGTFGLSYLKAVTAPINHVKILAVGGVLPENMKALERAGAKGFGIGSGIVDKNLIENNCFDQITQNARLYVEGLK